MKFKIKIKIRKKEKHKRKKEAIPKSSRLKLPLLNLKNIKNKLSLLQPQKIKTIFHTQSWSKNTTGWLRALIIILILWLIIEICIPVRLFKKEETVFTQTGLDDSLISQSIKPFSYYDKIFGSRELFKPSVEAKTGGIARIGAEKMLENLSLTGIISSGTNLQALITNKKDNSTSLYREGDTVAGFSIKKIEKSTITLEYAGQIIDLGR